MDRLFRLLVPALLLVAACGKAGNDQVKSSNGEVAPSGAASVNADATPVRDSSAAAPKGTATAGANLQGRIPVLEYHIIGSPTNTLYTRTAESFKSDMEAAYAHNFRPITIAQMLDKDFSDVPAGMSPVVFVFDDASDSQFRYREVNGKTEIDPTSGVGLWLEFAKTHPGWKNRGVFCMLNGAAAGHNFFGDNPKYNGQKKEWRFQKVKWLADQGFELCDHTLWHMKLNQYPDAAVQEQIARNAMGIDSAVPGYKIRTMALPYGLWPKNRQLAWKGSWTDPKTHQVHSYSFDAVLEVTGGPTRSPYDPQFDPKSISRIEAINDDIRKNLIRLDSTKTRFVAK
jgi:hypothetical protein